MSDQVSGTTSEPRQVRRVLAASLVGTTVEWYDFFIYASASGLVFGKLFFSGLGATAAFLASLATIGVSFVMRPFGGILAGLLGDSFGRRGVLVATLLLMGVATVGVGLLPTYASAGAAAPVMLVLLRLLQGLSAGGEWAGAALMAVEHAPRGRRGWYGVFPQLGVPLGLLLANLVFVVVAASMSDADFLAYGWRIPFLLSAVLIVVGLLVRFAVEESPVFTELRRRRGVRSFPVGAVVVRYPRRLLIGIGLFVGNNMAGYLLLAFITPYGTRTLGVSASTMLLIVIVSSVAWGCSTAWAARWSDRVGRRRVYLVGTIALLAWAFPLFLLLDTASPPVMLLAVVVFAIPLGLTYGQQSAAYAELFPAPVRYSGASLAYALGAVLGGAFAPLIAAALVESTGTSSSVSAYLVVMALITLAAVLAWRERPAAEREAFVDGEVPDDADALARPVGG